MHVKVSVNWILGKVVSSYLLREILHDVSEVLFTEEMFLNSVLLGTKMCWMRLSPAEHLNFDKNIDENKVIQLNSILIKKY